MPKHLDAAGAIPAVENRPAAGQLRRHGHRLPVSKRSLGVRGRTLPHGARRVLVLAAAAMVSATGCAVGPTGASPNSSSAVEAARYPLVVHESDGTSLTIVRPPQRIVSLSTAATEIFCTIGARAQLAAVELNANCPAGTSAKPTLDAYQPNPERIVGYQPDLVFVFDDTSSIVEHLRRLGIPVLYLQLPVTLQGVLDQIQLLGEVSGHAAKAQQIVQRMRGNITGITQKVSSIKQGPRFYYELDPTYFTVSDHSFVGDLFRVLKGQNIAADASQDYPQLSAEVIIQRNPQVIILGDGPAGVTAASVKRRAGWPEINAIRTGRICVVGPDAVNVPGPNIVDGLEALARCLYPDRFR